MNGTEKGTLCFKPLLSFVQEEIFAIETAVLKINKNNDWIAGSTGYKIHEWKTFILHLF